MTRFAAKHRLDIVALKREISNSRSVIVRPSSNRVRTSRAADLTRSLSDAFLTRNGKRATATRQRMHTGVQPKCKRARIYRCKRDTIIRECRSVNVGRNPRTSQFPLSYVCGNTEDLLNVRASYVKFSVK